MATRISKLKRRKPPKMLTSPTRLEHVASGLPKGQPAGVSEDEIRRRAYLGWEAAGKPIDDGVRFWLEAEQQLRQGRKLEIC